MDELVILDEKPKADEIYMIAVGTMGGCRCCFNGATSLPDSTHPCALIGHIKSDPFYIFQYGHARFLAPEIKMRRLSAFAGHAQE